jgi:serine/threonine protein phosphatase PrpC
VAILSVPTQKRKAMILPPQCLHEIGQRDKNEDSVYPINGLATAQNRLFMVCDGVGGSAKGEVASRLLIEGFAAYFAKNKVEISDESIIQTALEEVQREFDTYSEQQPDTAKMASTLTLLHLHAAGATVAHIGDSRVYHLRNGRILWQTEDHKMVTEMLKAGVLTPEQAVEHSQLNVISRAVQGKKIKAVKADVKHILHLLPDDYFFLCTDGVLEQLSEEMLEDIVKNTSSDTEKIRLIGQLCAGRTQDNYSAYLVHIVEEIGLKNPSATVADSDVIEIDLQELPLSAPTNLPPPKNQSNLPSPLAPKTSERVNWWQITLLILLAAILGWFLYQCFAPASAIPNLLNTPVKPHKK